MVTDPSTIMYRDMSTDAKRQEGTLVAASVTEETSRENKHLGGTPLNL